MHWTRDCASVLFEHRCAGPVMLIVRLTSTLMENLPSLQSRLYQVVSWNQDGEAIPDLVRDGVQIDYVHPSYGHTALHNACKCDRPRAIDMLLKHGADPNRRFTYRSPVDGRVEADRIALHYVSSADA